MNNSWKNLTPHPIIVVGGGATAVIIPPSGTVARVAQQMEEAGTVAGLRTVRSTFGEVQGLPAPDCICAHCGSAGCDMLSGGSLCGGEWIEPTRYIVSAMVRVAVPLRMDVFSPADFVRDEKGTIIGCRALEGNQ